MSPQKICLADLPKPKKARRKKPCILFSSKKEWVVYTHSNLTRDAIVDQLNKFVDDSELTQIYYNGAGLSVYRIPRIEIIDWLQTNRSEYMNSIYHRRTRECPWVRLKDTTPVK